jgi:MFS family permease
MSDRFPGNRVIAGCFIVLTVSSGLGFYGLAVYLNAFSRERGWDVASVSLATTLFFLVSGVVGLVLARLVARFDVRYVIVSGALLAGAALAVMGRVQEQWQLYVVYAVFAVGWAASGLVPATTVITRWFHVRRSVALSVASTGLSVGGILITPAAKWLLDEYGLEKGTPWLAVVWIVGIVPFALWLVRPSPERDGWLPDGARSVAGVAPAAPRGVPYADAIHTRFYLAVTIGFVLVLGSQVGAIQQLVKLAEERTDKSTASFATLVLAGTSVVARLVGGRVVTRVPMAPFTAALGVVQMVAMVAIAFADETLALFVAIVLFGITIGNLLMLQPLLIAERFGVRDYPRIFSRSQFVTVLGTAGGPLLLGLLRDEAGGYRTSYLVAAACSLAGAAVIATSGPATVPEP